MHFDDFVNLGRPLLSNFALEFDGVKIIFA